MYLVNKVSEPIILVTAFFLFFNVEKAKPQEKQMKKIKIIYVYDAICGWCFGFSPTIAALKEHYNDKITFEVVSGGLKLGSGSGPIEVVAPYIKNSYQDVEEVCGVKFGDKFVNGSLKKGTMVLNSLPPAIALCIIKERYPDKALEFAATLHRMYYVDGIEPEDYDAYGVYAEKFGYDRTEFNIKMKDSAYIKMAYHDFEYARQNGANSFPTVIIEKDGKKEVLFSGFLSFEKAKQKIDTKL